MTFSRTEFHGGKIVLFGGDCLEVLPSLPDNSIDSICCDPPYHLLSTVKRFAKSGGSDRIHNGDDQYGRLSRGFMGKAWDGGDIAFRAETWAKVLRVLKPGGHLIAFSAPKCSHRMVCAIEDAGFEIRDGLMWLFGTGFPKSHDVSKGIDKAAGAEREVVGYGCASEGGAVQRKPRATMPGGNGQRETIATITAPATDAARQWEGWGTALKPAYEPICLARKPLEKGLTVAKNVLKYGVGALNIDGCRVNVDGESTSGGGRNADQEWCPIHGLRGLSEADARLEMQGEKGEAADYLRRDLSGGADARESEPKLHAGSLLRQPDGVSSAKNRQTDRIGSPASAQPDASGLFGTPNGDGPIFGEGSSSRGERTSHQREQDRQSDREFGVDRLDIARSGTRQDRTDNDSASKGEPEAPAIARGRTGQASADRRYSDVGATNFAATPGPRGGSPIGRWPANILHDGSAEVVTMFPETSSGGAPTLGDRNGNVWGEFGKRSTTNHGASVGSAARFFYCAKASKYDRAGSKHPTVKPVELMRWLVRLITPPAGTVLDCFAGTGTTGEAALLEGFRAILIEREAEYCADIARRMEHVSASARERGETIVKECGQVADAGPLFDGVK